MRIKTGMFRRAIKIAVLTALLGATFGTSVDGSTLRPKEAPVFTNVAGGLYHTCAITDTHQLYCWGNNWYGQLGTGDSDPIEGKHLVQGELTGKEVVDISLGAYNTCATTSDGMAYCWGSGASGVLGSGLTSSFYEPLALIGGSLESAYVLNIDTSDWNTCANTSTGFSCWGDNFFHQVNLTSSAVDVLSPVALTHGVLTDDEVDNFSVGEFVVCAVVNAQAACWGNDMTDRRASHYVTRGYLRSKQVTNVGVGIHMCALTTRGTVACWGRNTLGQLGDGSNTDRAIPRQVKTGALANVLVEQLEVSEEGTCVITTRAKLVCWGKNVDGQLGDGSTQSKSTPIRVNSRDLRRRNVISVGMGTNHTCAVTEEGQIACWGDNAQGQLGDGTTYDSDRPKFIVWE